MNDLSTLRRTGLKRAFGRRYMEVRRATEDKLRRLFVESGGRPERAAPHYFVLGECAWYRGLSPDMRSIKVRLSELNADTTSVTYPDSFTAMGLVQQFGLPYEPKPYHDRVYRLGDLDEVVTQFGLPDGEPDADYSGYRNRPFEKYIEVQVWSDVPLEQAEP